ncbi:Uncharacterized protein dnl_41210 [Desulfonema limicola]|uniref:Uncharacterized protein n=1 Tax=Desulfonema limicola TaxID=45656 RepID=A0A975BAI9_9BACT|nr:Uncharacterized protein dnl_41210 [Desulfonema limicola]
MYPTRLIRHSEYAPEVKGVKTPVPVVPIEDENSEYAPEVKGVKTAVAA